jgi:hypothetical protein
MYVQIYRGKKQRERLVVSSRVRRGRKSVARWELSMEKSVGGVQARCVRSPC